MMRTTTLALLAGAAAIGLAGAAQAQDRGAPQSDLTRTEAQQHAAQMFERMDANRDGELDAADREARVKARFDRVDADGDGALSFDEYTASRGDRAEGASHGKRGERMGRHSMRGALGMGASADADGDGAITRAEFETAALTRFDAADTDGNGTLTAAERKAQHESRRDRWRERRSQRTD